MSPLCYFLSLLTIAFAIGCVLFRRKGKSFEGMLCKFMSSFGFISVAIVGYLFNPENVYYFCLVCFALFFGFFGDVLLGIKEIAPTFRGKLIPLGTMYFLFGHIFFIIALLLQCGFNIITLLIGIAGGAVAFALIKVLKMKVNSALRIIMSVYFAALIYKVANASLLIIQQGAKTSYVMALIGSILFVISDTCLSLLYFTPVKRKNFWVTVELSSYYPAQILFAMSVAMMK